MPSKRSAILGLIVLFGIIGAVAFSGGAAASECSREYQYTSPTYDCDSGVNDDGDIEHNYDEKSEERAKRMVYEGAKCAGGAYLGSPMGPKGAVLGCGLAVAP